MRALFFGTPDIAVPSLLALARLSTVVGVVSQPDRPAGRGMNLRAPAVKLAAQELGLETWQPEKVRDGTLFDLVQRAKVDVAVVIAYGRILPLDVLTAPRLGCVNLHASLLPKYRGAAPIQRALMNGEKETGVCLMQMEEGMDTGPVFSQRVITISPEDNHASLAERLGRVAAKIVTDDLPRLVAGELRASSQNEDQATHAPPIGADDALLDLRDSALRAHNQIRGLSPKPGAWALIQRPGTKDRRLKILVAHATSDPGQPGCVREDDGRLLIGCGTGSLILETAQVEGKTPQTARELLNGRALLPGDLLVGPSLHGRGS